jgi:GNAT superfamily N-acetyltransferase
MVSAVAVIEKALMGENVDIREFSVQDRESVRRISCETAFAGAPGEKIFSDDEILADVLTSCFTDYEPQSCFVAVVNNRVVGYICGAKDAAAMKRVFNRRVLSGLVMKAFRRGVFFDRKNLRFFRRCLISMFRGEFRVPDFSGEFPAILHINLDKNFRGQAIGSKLIARFLRYLKEGGVSGVHLGTLSEDAGVFFKKTGFDLLFQGRRSYLKDYTGRDLDFYVFGKNSADERSGRDS